MGGSAIAAGSASLFDQIKERLGSVERVLAHHGIRPDRAGCINCISPTHRDDNPSMKVYSDHVHCYACGWHGDIADIDELLSGLGRDAWLDRWRERLGLMRGRSGPPSAGRRCKTKSSAKQPVPTRASSEHVASRRSLTKDEAIALWSAGERDRASFYRFVEQLRAGHADCLRAGLHPGKSVDHQMLANLRHISVEGVRLAVDRGLIRFGLAPLHGVSGLPSWFVTDSSGRNIQARRIDGKLWDHRFKARSERGSCAGWPIGAANLSTDLNTDPYPILMLVEGGPDVLAAHHVIAAERNQDYVAVLGMLGSHPIHEDALQLLEDRLVVIYPHNDKAGRDAAHAWAKQIFAATRRTNIMTYDFAGLIMADDQPVSDLNDACTLSPDQLPAPLIWKGG